MHTLLTQPTYDELATAEKLRQVWISQSIARCFEDPEFGLIVLDPRKNPGPTLEDVRAILNKTRTLH